jgi:hypothetical protein
MQEIDTRKPVGVTVVEAAADTLRWNTRHVGAVGEGGADNVVLPLDAELTGPYGQHIVLELEFTATEGRITLRIDRLVELESRSCLTGDASQVFPVSRR